MTPNHLELKSADGTKLNLEALYQIAPSCFTEVKDEKTGELRHVVNFTTLRQLLGDDAVDDAPEMYQFTWPGKQEARREAARPITDTLRPCPEESVDWDTTQNLYIEGDNLAVLKLLQKGYMGKVKMIYIDPPYNTGSDFVYHDDFAVSQKEMDRFSGDVDEDGNRYRKNSDSNGRFHSDWCSMMYSRLLVSRSLLTEDGFIFISIDDHEVDNLKKICSEVFGASNFIQCITRSTGTPTGGGFEGVVNELDYILVFAKNASEAVINGLPMSEEDASIYNQQDEKGRYLTRSLRRTGGEDRREDRPSMFFPITAPDGTDIYPIGPTGYESRWICSQNTVKEMEAKGLLEWKKVIREGEEKWQVMQKFYLEGRTKAPGNLWDDVEGNKKATRDIRELFDTIKVFDFPKPVGVLKKILAISTNPGDLIIDFFSGSATTAHAVMSLNASSDDTGRKYICVQLPEDTPEESDAYKAGYRTIPEIAKERIRRAGKKIKDEAGVLASTIDTGFRVLKLSGSNFNEVYFTPKEFTQDLLSGLESNIKEDRTDLDLLFGAMLNWGVQLSLPMSKETVDGCDIYTVNEGDLVACFSENVTENVVSAMAAKMPLRVLFRDSCFSDDKAKINIFELFKQKLDWGEDEAIKNIRVI